MRRPETDIKAPITVIGIGATPPSAGDTHWLAKERSLVCRNLSSLALWDTLCIRFSALPPLPECDEDVESRLLGVSGHPVEVAAGILPKVGGRTRLEIDV